MIKIRIAEVFDAEELLKIYKPYVENTAISFEYTVPDIEDFKGRIENTLKKYPYLVAVCDNEIVGYAYAGAFKSRAAYDYSVETSIYIKEGHKKQGIGKLLYSALFDALKLMNITNVNACIAMPQKENAYLDSSSMYFHEKMGFQLVGTFHSCAYKFDSWFDMIWMEMNILPHVVPPTEVICFDSIKDDFLNLIQNKNI